MQHFQACKPNTFDEVIVLSDTRESVAFSHPSNALGGRPALGSNTYLKYFWSGTGCNLLSVPLCSPAPYVAMICSFGWVLDLGTGTSYYCMNKHQLLSLLSAHLVRASSNAPLRMAQVETKGC